LFLPALDVEIFVVRGIDVSVEPRRESAPEEDEYEDLNGMQSLL
jgi:hypothetical protein